MIPIIFAGFLLLSVTVALTDWRRGWLMAILCGVLQDPARKLTPGSPVAMSLSVVIVYVAVLFAGSTTIRQHAAEFTRRFSRVYGALIIVFLFLVLAALRGLFTYGMEGWKVPALSLFIYSAPIPAVLLGYTYLQREENLYKLFRFYAIVTSIALLGTPLEYMNVDSPVLGTVALHEANMRHLPGIQIRMLSGFYRAPDVMGWHAATLAIVGLIMIVRRQSLRQSWIWMLVTGWAAFNCILSGRRKAVYMIAIFALVFVWRFFRRLTTAQVFAFAMTIAVVGGVVQKIAEDEQSNVYTRGTVTSRQEVYERLEGGLVETVRQFGVLGAGLGSATQGVQHVAPAGSVMGWQEGGLGKLAVELGVPGLVAALLFAVTMFRLMLKITVPGDVEGSSQFTRCALFAIVVANMVEFLVSAQAYSDAVLALMTAFFMGCLFATTVLDERLAASPAGAPGSPLTTPATA